MLISGQKKNGPSAGRGQKEMTLDCPFRNPLQSRVIPVLSYYLTSYGYLRFYWIRSAASPSTILRFFYDHPFCCRYYGLTPHMWGPLVGSPSCLPLGSAALRCLRFSVLPGRDFGNPLILQVRWLFSLAPSQGRRCFTTEYFDRTGNLSCWGAYLYIGLTLPCSGYNLPH